MKLTVIIPVYNEACLIEKVIERVKSVRLPANITKEIIIVDDGSTDGTLRLLKKYEGLPPIKIFYRNRNAGKTEAVKLGLEKSTGDILLIQDADLEYNPDDYPKLLEPFIKYNASVVYGSRFMGAMTKMPLINRVANIISNITLRLLFDTALTDVHTCYKLFKKEVFKDIKITSRNFTFDTEITTKLLKNGYKIFEVPIRYIARSKKEGKKITWLKALEVYWGIIKYRFKD